MTNGLKLKRLRQAYGVSRAELAATLGLAVSTIGKLERGEKAPSVEVLAALIRWSDGALSAEDFCRPERRTSLAAVQPYIRTPSEDEPHPGAER